LARVLLVGVKRRFKGGNAEVARKGPLLDYSFRGIFSHTRKEKKGNRGKSVGAKQEGGMGPKGSRFQKKTCFWKNFSNRDRKGGGGGGGVFVLSDRGEKGEGGEKKRKKKRTYLGGGG